MKKKIFTRIISKIVFKDGYTVQSYNYDNYVKLGSLEKTIKYLNDWGADEIILINLSSENHFKNIQNSLKDNFIPITYAGKVNNLNTYKWAINSGFEKVSFNTAVFNKKFNLINECANLGGAQSIVLCLDIIKNSNKLYLYNYLTKETKKIEKNYFYDLASKNYLSEMLINIINQDGGIEGINNFKFFKEIQKKINLPLLVSCGLFTKEQYINFLLETNCIPVLGNMLLHYENPIASIRHVLSKKGYKSRIDYPFKGISR